jgi:hypothetical protein
MRAKSMRLHEGYGLGNCLATYLTKLLAGGNVLNICQVLYNVLFSSLTCGGGKFELPTAGLCVGRLFRP